MIGVDPEAGLPVANGAASPRTEVPDLILAGMKLGHPAKHGPVALHVLEGEVLANPVEVRLGADVRGHEERLDLGGEEDPLRRGVQVEGLHAEVVAREEDRACLPVEEGEGEHAVQPLDAGGTPLLVRLEDDLRVGRRPEGATAGPELVAKLHVVVDLTVEDDDRPLGGHGLLPTRQVDDREPLVGERDRSLRELAGSVRAAVTDASRHPDRQIQAGRLPVEAKYSGDSAHGSGAPPWSQDSL